MEGKRLFIHNKNKTTMHHFFSALYRKKEKRVEKNKDVDTGQKFFFFLQGKN